MDGISVVPTRRCRRQALFGIGFGFIHGCGIHRGFCYASKVIAATFGIAALAILFHIGEDLYRRAWPLLAQLVETLAGLHLLVDVSIRRGRETWRIAELDKSGGVGKYRCPTSDHGPELP